MYETPNPNENLPAEQPASFNGSAIASAMAGLVIRRQLLKGHTISIPSLGISYSYRDIENPPTEEEMEAARLEDAVDDAERSVKYGDAKTPDDDTNGFLTPVLLWIREAYLQGEINIGSYARILDERVKQLIEESEGSTD